MEAIILAGGLGTRLRVVNPDSPKPMALIGSRPFLEILMCSLATKGFKRIILSLGYMSEIVISYFGDRYLGMEIDYVIEDSPLGTGGAVRLAMTKSLVDHVYIFNGDTFLELDFQDLESAWQDTKSPIIVGSKINNAERYGTLIIENDRVVGFKEKGFIGPGVINAGCYIFNRNQLNHFQLYKKFSLEADYLTEVISVEPFNLFIASGIFIDIGVPDDFFRAQLLLRNH
jgi:D-glycero-alpha-D-manno-heptose 1-phosphate guanylyltransferase